MISHTTPIFFFNHDLPGEACKAVFLMLLVTAKYIAQLFVDTLYRGGKPHWGRRTAFKIDYIIIEIYSILVSYRPLS